MAPVIYHLSEVGVNVDAVICLKAQNYDSLTPSPDHKNESQEDDEATKVRIVIICDKLHL